MHTSQNCVEQCNEEMLHALRVVAELFVAGIILLLALAYSTPMSEKLGGALWHATMAGGTILYVVGRWMLWPLYRRLKR